jgi:DNA mismatch repair protein MutS
MQARRTPRPPARTGLTPEWDGPSPDDQHVDGHQVGAPKPAPGNHAALPDDASVPVGAQGGLAPTPDDARDFHSILAPPGAEGIAVETSQEPGFFADLSLDKIVAAITAGKADYDLPPFFYRPCRDLATIEYRHEVMQDLEHEDVWHVVRSFAEGMRSVHQHLNQSAELYHPHQKKLWFLDAVQIYCGVVAALAQALHAANLQSRGLVGLRSYLIDYTNSERLTALVADTAKLTTALATVKYSMLIKDDKVTVQHYEKTTDYSVKVERTFDRFKQGAVRDYRVKFPEVVDLNHVEAGVLGFVANLYPEIFSDLDDYVTRNQGCIDPTIGRFDREIQFYVSYLEHISVLKGHGLRFCYPQLSRLSKAVRSREGFDLALAHQLTTGQSAVVCNDFYLKDSERILVVSGPNQGGKTTFARTFGQLHYLASLGCPVPGAQAELFLFDRLFAHFERSEDITTLRGKLEDDLFRIHQILAEATPDSIIIMNEIFNSTTLRDAIFLGRTVLGRIMDLDALAVCVTFIDELAGLSAKTVSMVSTVVPENPAIRTFKIMRKPADGLAYALSIAAKYGLTYDRLGERIRS